MWVRNQTKNRLSECNDISFKKVREWEECDRELVLETFSYEEIEGYRSKEGFELESCFNQIVGIEQFRVYKTANLNNGFKISNQNDISLGIYSTKEKALKVLDEIQKGIVYVKDGVYNMPKDEEVSVDE